MRPAFYNNPEYKQKQSTITRKGWKNGKYSSLIRPLELRYCKNSNCNLPFQVKPYDPKKYCSYNCSAHITNSNRKQLKEIPCLTCGKQTKRPSYKYCSNKCQINYRYAQYISRWKQGLEDGNRGITTKIISRHLRRYLSEKYGEKCSICGWNKKHTKTLVVPFEVNHIDGNSDNNYEINLELLCPNCHALTLNFRNLNKGKGRTWRTKHLKVSY